MNNLQIDNFLVDIPNFLLSHHNQYMVFVAFHFVQLIELKHKHDHPDEDNQFLVLRQKA